MKKSGSKSASNYMKSTASADARREQSIVSRKSPHNSSLHKKSSTNSPNICLNSSKDGLARTTSLKIMRIPKKKTPRFDRNGSRDDFCKNLQVDRATYSSTLKGCKFPGTESEGTSGVKVCSYSRCSLSGHRHALLPPLKKFVSARRRALKTERGIKQRCQSPKARPTWGTPNCAELIGRDEPAPSNGEGLLENLSNGEICHDIDPRENLEQIGGLSSAERATAAHVHDRVGRFFDEISVDEVSQESFDEDSLNDFLFEGRNTPRIGPQSDLKDEPVPNEDATREMVNQASYLSKGCVDEETTWVDSAMSKASKHDQDHVENECHQEEYFGGGSTKDFTNVPYPAECTVVREVDPRNRPMPETAEKSSTRAKVESQKSNQESDETRHINPNELHFLPLEPDSEAEKVNLRHKELDARKNAEEWMIDYALREEVTRISPARQRKVALLVEAFERVLPTSKS